MTWLKKGWLHRAGSDHGGARSASLAAAKETSGTALVGQLLGACWAQRKRRLFFHVRAASGTAWLPEGSHSSPPSFSCSLVPVVWPPLSRLVKGEEVPEGAGVYFASSVPQLLLTAVGEWRFRELFCNADVGCGQSGGWRNFYEVVRSRGVKMLRSKGWRLGVEPQIRGLGPERGTEYRVRATISGPETPEEPGNVEAPPVRPYGQ